MHSWCLPPVRCTGERRLARALHHGRNVTCADYLGLVVRARAGQLLLPFEVVGVIPVASLSVLLESRAHCILGARLAKAWVFLVTARRRLHVIVLFALVLYRVDVHFLHLLPRHSKRISSRLPDHRAATHSVFKCLRAIEWQGCVEAVGCRTWESTIALLLLIVSETLMVCSKRLR